MRKITLFKTVLVIVGSLFCIQFSNAAEAPKVGRKAAAKYFQAKGQGYTADSSGPENNSSPSYYDRYPSSIEALSSGDHYLALGIGSFTSSTAYNWGHLHKETDLASTGIDMTYRLSQASSLFDEIIRVSYNIYSPEDKSASKMSFLYGITFPDAGSQFPLYFGAVVGPGVFFKQLEGESALSLDYQMFLGLRLFNMFEKTGFFLEGGLKNHLQLTSDGQFNGTYISAGAVFTF